MGFSIRRLVFLFSLFCISLGPMVIHCFFSPRALQFIAFFISSLCGLQFIAFFVSVVYTLFLFRPCGLQFIAGFVLVVYSSLLFSSLMLNVKPLTELAFGMKTTMNYKSRGMKIVISKIGTKIVVYSRIYELYSSCLQLYRFFFCSLGIYLFSVLTT